jgi:modulator of FtsH protease
MRNNTIISSLQGSDAIEVNSVLRNTYLLLSLTLAFSALCAWYSMSHATSQPHIIVFFLLAFGLQFATYALRNSPWGLVCIFGFTGFLGYSMGPLLNAYIHGFSNGTELITTALGATALVFLGLSAYTVTQRKNYSYMGGFICAGSIAVFAMMILSFIIQAPFFVVMVSGAFCVISSAYILYTTSAIIHGGERNYICATISLYVAIYNLFISLLNILSFFAGRRD